MVTAYGWKNAFGLASQRCEVLRLNNAPMGEGGVDDDAQERLEGHGICCGIASTWIIGFVSGNVPEASDPSSFRSYFDNVLRFQGAYMKDVGGRTDKHIDELAKANFDSGLKKIKSVELSVMDPGGLPDGTWAAYAAVWHHAIGIGHRGGNYYIMEPNFGLYVYSSKSHFLLDFQNLIEARRRRKNKKVTDNIKLFFYGAA